MIDAIVVGAGLSGLVCARRLVEGGASVNVVDARDRVGGRLLTGTIAGVPIDLGGQWMSVDQPRLAALATELGITSFPQRREGNILIDVERDAHRWWSRLGSALAQWRIGRRISRLSHAPPAGADRESLAGWLAREASNTTARAMVALHAELVFAADPADLSLLHYLRTLAATGGFAPQGPDLPGGGREHRFTGGAQQLACRLADRLGDAVRLSTPIETIRDDDDHVIARGPTGELTARRLVLAVPPSLARAIDMPLAPAAQRMVDATQLGPVVKCFAAYEAPFWREAGFSGEAYRPRGTVRATIALEGPEGGPAILLAFVVGRMASGWSARPASDRRAQVLEALGDQFGDRAAAPIDYVEVDWGADRWSGGCVAGVAPGVLSAGAAWGHPHGRILIAGTEAARVWPGYMEGAIEAGERAAADVLSASRAARPTG